MRFRCFIPFVAGLLLGWGISSPVAASSEAWEAAVVVPEVRIAIHWVSHSELSKVAFEVGKRARTRPHGFSVLRHNPGTREYRCDIYLLKRPARVDDQATVTLGHELAHCLGFSHDEGG